MEQLTDDQINLMVESLLFSACLEITDNWTSEHRAEMLNIALNLKQQNNKLQNIEMHHLARREDSLFTTDELSLNNQVVKNFPELAVIQELV